MRERRLERSTNHCCSRPQCPVTLNSFALFSGSPSHLDPSLSHGRFATTPAGCYVWRARVLRASARVLKRGDVSAGGSVWKGKSLSERSASVPTVSDGGRPVSRPLALLRVIEIKKKKMSLSKKDTIPERRKERKKNQIPQVYTYPKENFNFSEIIPHEWRSTLK